ncbi:hypothetical protein GALL_426390 [mine drainage metagenome]|uniref:Uncharacterized protein n=1 Tax=mine drainage metagenome TaxID=410659 RepID=A0A1J5PW45_9ZZZZ
MRRELAADASGLQPADHQAECALGGAQAPQRIVQADDELA